MTITQTKRDGIVSKAASPAKTIIAVSIGNALEWFDIVIYGFMAVTISRLFFPDGDSTVSLLLTLGTFGVSFFMRPLGAIVLGAYADRAGRKKALTLSITLMTLGTLIIAISPSYGTIGLAAPLLVLIARLIQGFSAGGEFGSATALLSEQDPDRRGFYASWQSASQGITTVLASGFGVALNALLTPDQLMNWGWRIPFFFGLLVGPIAIYIRRELEEGEEFQTEKASPSPILETLVTHRGRIITAIGLIVLGTTISYASLFTPTFAIRQLKLPATAGFTASLILGVLQFFLSPLFGMLSDRMRRTRIMTIAAGSILVAVLPLYTLLAAYPTTVTLYLVQIVLAVGVSAYFGPLSSLMAEIFPARIRGTGLSVGYSFGVAIFGGFAPFIIAWLLSSTGSLLAPGFYVAAAALLSLIALRYSERYL